MREKASFILALVLLSAFAFAQSRSRLSGSDGVALTGDQTVAGVKTFSSQLIVSSALGINMSNAGATLLIGGKDVLFVSTGTFLRGLATDTGGADVAVTVVNDEQLTTAGDLSFSVRNGEAGVGPVVFSVNYLGNTVQPFTDQSADCDNAATGNAPTGKVCIQAGQASMTLTNSSVTAGSMVMVTNQSDDTTCINTFAAASGAGTVVIGCSGAATPTANMVVKFQVLNH